MSQENDQNNKKKWLPDHRIGFSERNLNRWSIYGSRNAQIERVIKREDAKGNVVETCQIGAVGYKGKMRSLSSVHGRLMNIVEMLFRRQGCPENNTIRISSIGLYNYLTDISSLFNPEKMKDRNGNKFRDWIYDTLHVLAQVTLMFSSWEKKNGSRGAYGFKIIKAFKIWGKDTVGVEMDAEWGMIKIMLDPEYADGLRERNTTPILIEVENSIQGDNAFALYRYLRQVLFKTPVFKCRIIEFHERLSIGHSRKDRLIEDFRGAAKEIQGREIPNGRIASCEVIQEEGDWILKATLGSSVVKRMAALNARDEKKHFEEQRLQDALVEEEDYLKAFENLPADEKSKRQKQIDLIVAERTRGLKTVIGLSGHIRYATIEVMHQYFMNGSNQVGHNLCANGNGKQSSFNDSLKPSEYLSTAEWDKRAIEMARLCVVLRLASEVRHATPTTRQEAEAR